MDEDEHGGAGVSAAQTDVVQAAVVAQRQLAVGVDLVVADPEVAVGQRNARSSGLGRAV
ncbi:hypothetical protein [Geodermatophilus pulveris]|uniref:hypothetical protein n=1 Tax=Geodermatophilus pulveris TaxID=1564159 RepID=UPI0015C59EFB|nr:hypothetical protein [Geodermatophilus pulveris]